MVSKEPEVKNAIGDAYSLLRVLRKQNPVEALKLRKKIKKKKNKLNNKLKTEDDKKKRIICNIKNESDDFNNIGVEYVLPSIDDITKDDDLAECFVDVFQRFRPSDDNKDSIDEDDSEGNRINFHENSPGFNDQDNDNEDDDEEMKPQISKKKLKQMSRISLAQLKQMAQRPDVVEIWDTTAADPQFLVYLKSCRNTVMVPGHWCLKRKYMQGKRGIEKSTFKLPSYIEATKISEIRRAIQEKDMMKSNKQKQKEKVHPKMHRMDIDYQVLHDAFFKYATKPKLTKFGDVYYEGKENEMKMRKYKPGVLSETIREALGMGVNAPPPWLINMQRYGPPPRYPRLKIPGLNAPIPAGAEYGFHPGGWGKPPVDEFGNPLYGDLQLEETNAIQYDETLWGELQSEEEEEDEEESTQAIAGTDGEGIRTPASTVGMQTPLLATGGIVTETSGLRSTETLTSGLETPESVDIRKRGLNTTPKPYTILQQQPAPAQPGALFASNITYKMPSKATGISGQLRTINSGLVTPGEGTLTPVGSVGGVVTPYGGAGGVITPYGGTGGVVTPYGGAEGGAITPYAGIGGLVTPYGSGALAAGMITPVIKGGPGDRSVDISASQTPSGVPLPPGLTVSLNPSAMEQEGVFTADVIRQQLKHHEEAAMRVKQAAKQIDLQDVRKRKEGTDTKKKKKDKFKF